MTRKLDLSQILKTFEGNDITKEDRVTPFSFKDGLLTYLRNASRMGINDNEQNTAYILGVLIGQSEGDIEISSEQYDCLKKLADFGKVKLPNGQIDEIWQSIEIKLQLKTLIDS